MKTLFRTLIAALLLPCSALASVSVTVNGTSYTIPQTSEKGWGNNVTSWIQAISSNTLYPNSATFTLTSELDFGASYGLKSLYYKSRTSNPASAGQIRLANADLIDFRNAANSGNIPFGAGSSDSIPSWNSIDLANVSSSQTLSNKSLTSTSTVSSVTANPAGAGFIRMASTDAIKWRNNANGADVTLGKDASDQLTWAGTSVFSNAGILLSSAAPAFTGGDVTSSSGSLNLAIGAGRVTNTMLAGSIAASKLVGSDIATVGTITTGTWSANSIATSRGGTGTDFSGSTGLIKVAAGTMSAATLVNADVSSSAAIAYSKLNLTGAILNADLAGSIADTKLSTIATAGKISDSALPSSMATKTFTGVTSFPTSSSIDGSGNAAFGGTLACTSTATVGLGTATTAALSLGATANAINGGSQLKFVNSNAQLNWEIAANTRSNGRFDITPSTGTGTTNGNIFSTPALTIDSSSVVTATGTLKTSATTDATTVSTGALQSAGGLGVAKTAWVGGDLNLGSASSGAVTGATQIKTQSGSAGSCLTHVTCSPTFAFGANTSGVILIGNGNSSDAAMIMLNNGATTGVITGSDLGSLYASSVAANDGKIHVTASGGTVTIYNGTASTINPVLLYIKVL